MICGFFEMQKRHQIFKKSHLFKGKAAILINKSNLTLFFVSADFENIHKAESRVCIKLVFVILVPIFFLLQIMISGYTR